MKKNNLKISIITCCYNSEKTIKDTIESVLSQSYKNYEYIIVDGKSKDKTLEIVESYNKKFDGKMIVSSEKDKSLFDAMNKGIKKATGDIIAIINSDDVLAHKNVFKDVVNKFENNKIQIVYSDLMFYDESLTKMVRVFKTGKGNILRGWHPPHPTLYVSKKVYEEIGGFNLKYKIAADLDLMIRMVKPQKYKLLYVEDVFVKMRAGGVSTAGLKGYMRNFKEAIQVYKDNNIKFPILINIYRIFKTLIQILKSKLTKKAR